MKTIQIKTFLSFVIINSILVSTVQAVKTGDDYENDDRYFVARFLDQGQYHNIEPKNDIDWVKFYAVENTAYTITASNLEKYCDITLELFNFSEQEAFLYSVNKGGEGENEMINIMCNKNSLYHVKIKPSYPYVYGKGTSYYLSLTNSKSYDVFENDDNVKSAKSLVVNASYSQTHSFHNNYDIDLFKFFAISRYNYIVKVENLNDNCIFSIENLNNGHIEQISNSKTIDIVHTEGMIYLKTSCYNNLCYHSIYSIRVDIYSGISNDISVCGCIKEICSNKFINNAIIISDPYHSTKTATTDSGCFRIEDHEKTSEPVLFTVNTDQVNSVENYLNYQMNLVVDNNVFIQIYLISNIEQVITDLKQLSGIKPERSDFYPVRMEHIICKMKSLSGVIKPYHIATDY